MPSPAPRTWTATSDTLKMASHAGLVSLPAAAIGPRRPNGRVDERDHLVGKDHKADEVVKAESGVRENAHAHNGSC